jgi:hypothetical protein
MSAYLVPDHECIARILAIEPGVTRNKGQPYFKAHIVLEDGPHRNEHLFAYWSGGWTVGAYLANERGLPIDPNNYAWAVNQLYRVRVKIDVVWFANVEMGELRRNKIDILEKLSK